MKAILLLILIIGTVFVGGCNVDQEGQPQATNITQARFTQTLNSYYYSIDCKHNVICYFSYGTATQVSCTSVNYDIIREECK